MGILRTNPTQKFLNRHLEIRARVDHEADATQGLPL